LKNTTVRVNSCGNGGKDLSTYDADEEEYQYGNGGSGHTC